MIPVGKSCDLACLSSIIRSFKCDHGNIKLHHIRYMFSVAAEPTEWAHRERKQLKLRKAGERINAVESALCGHGREDYSFAGFGSIAATIYSLIGKTKLNGIDPNVICAHLGLHSRQPVKLENLEERAARQHALKITNRKFAIMNSWGSGF